MARHKPDPANAIDNLDRADDALVELARLDREIQQIQITLNADIENARIVADGMAAPLREKRSVLEQALALYATANKDSLFKRGRSLKLTHGTFGFRASDELKTLTKVSWKEVVGNLKAMAAKLKALDLPLCIRVKEKPDKEALRQLPEKLREEAGVRIVPKDAFYYETNEETVAEKSAA